MNAGRTARDRARAELTQEIKNEARRQLAVDGAQKLSLRSVARELGMVSSALYRYFPSRDELLTALIIDAYNALGEAAETAVASGSPRERWRRACHAVRDWARANPHEYALIYGSPIPGYVAPQDTVVSAARVPLAMVGILREVELKPVFDGPPLTGGLAGQLRVLGVQIAPELSPETLNRLLVVWTQLFGMISFELFGQLVGSVDPADEFFDHTVGQFCDFVGLPVTS
ncbi:AcrR family transcriptional regulator [Kibdelosporangium banguiense]|uniref:AcrR family transcriptional regulator n=1 Tax=Kibdelosporangium banguiense TaxID=1365924 RepID=A0ABS4TMK6_9PSEU|nr:TetR/AcrR family transcriptional regulator [Kibdelosporangium banguiense]MBP2325635.1 AcrR family transcriptional regulator [Kibdelosporangium banguiense]